MKLIPVAVLALLSSAMAQTTTLHEAHHASDSQGPQVTLYDLVAHSKDYAGKPVTVTATAASGMEFSIFTDDSCQPAPDKTKPVLATFSQGHYDFRSPLNKKLTKILKRNQQAEIIAVGSFEDPGKYIGHQLCCRYEFAIQELISVKDVGKSGHPRMGDR